MVETTILDIISQPRSGILSLGFFAGSLFITSGLKSAPDTALIRRTNLKTIKLFLRCGVLQSGRAYASHCSDSGYREPIVTGVVVPH
jgi:hypothetical protein